MSIHRNRPALRHLAALATAAVLVASCSSDPAEDPSSAATTPAETPTLEQEVVAVQLGPTFQELVDECVASGDFTTVIDDIACADLWSDDERNRLNPEGDTFDPEDVVYRDDWVEVSENSDQGVFASWQWEQRAESDQAANTPGQRSFTLTYAVEDGTAVLTGLEPRTS